MIAFRPKLATKLITALLIPLLAMGLLAVLLVGTFKADSLQAQGELVQVRASIALTQAGAAIRDELSAMAVLPLTGENLDLPRQATDEALAGVVEVIGNDDPLVTSTRSRIDEARTILGDRPATIRRWIADEEATGERGIAFEQIQTYRQASVAFLQAATFENPEALSGEAAASLATVQLLSNYNVAIQTEYDAFSEFAGLPALAPPSRVQELALEVQLAIEQSQTARRAILAIASSDLRGEIANLEGSQEFRDVTAIRQAISPGSEGQLRTLDQLRAVSRSISDDYLANSVWSLSSSLDVLQFRAVQELEQGAESRLGTAQLALKSTVGFAVFLALLVILLGFGLYRSIRSPIQNLTKQSLRIANVELPEVVNIMREQGVGAEIPTIEPIKAQTKDEIGDLVVAFNQMHVTAVQLAGEQAAARATVGDMFVNLGRRNQKLLLRLLDHLDSLERRATNADVLEELFKVDHLATRMRRNAESLLVLAGARSTRHFEEPCALSAILRSSLAEVEGYERVRLNIADDLMIDAGAIADLSHLISELVENALNFSPPSTMVEIAARRGENSLLLAVADQGKGMTAIELDAANRRIAEAAENTETPSRFLGHYVSGRLAARHNLEIKLMPGLPAGLICRIRIPQSIIAGDAMAGPGVSGPIGPVGLAGPGQAVPEIPAALKPTAPAAPVRTARQFSSGSFGESHPTLPIISDRPSAPSPPRMPTSGPIDRSQPTTAHEPPSDPGNGRYLPGSAPAPMTTDGPTTGALAGSRRRVPMSDRSPAATTPEVAPPSHGGVLSSLRRQPGANMPKGLEPQVPAVSVDRVAENMEEALSLTRSADAVASSLSGLQAGFRRADHLASAKSWSEGLENPYGNADGEL